MNKKERVILVSLLFSAILNFPTYAQEVVAASGADASGTNGKVSYTVGQTFFRGVTGSTATVSEGVQQPYEIFVITDVSPALSEGINLQVYPNPTPDRLILSIGQDVNLGWHYKFTNSRGETISKGQITGSKTIFNLSDHSRGFYFLSVYQTGSDQKVFKVLKK